MTRHISFPPVGEGLGTAATSGRGGAGSGVATLATGGACFGSETGATRERVATSGLLRRLSPRIRRSTPAPPTKIHFGKRCGVAASVWRGRAGGRLGAWVRTGGGGGATGTD